MNSYNKAKFKFIFAMACFGTIGIVTSFISLHSSAIVFYRSLFSCVFLISVTLISKRKIGLAKIEDNKFLLILAGIFMGLNWVFQFESFRTASVSVGTVCYNTMPIFVLFLSPFMFKEKLTIKSILCIAIAMIGVALVSNVFTNGIKSNEILGCAYGILAAIFYALVVMITKKMSDINSYDKLIIEFFVAMVIMIPYIFLSKDATFVFTSDVEINSVIIGIILLVLLGFYYSGICYVIYFDAADLLKASDIAVYTYIDPVVALICSHFILHENLNLMQLLGASLILISTFVASAV